MIREKLPKLDLNITNKCNYRCTHCAFDSGCFEMPELSLQEEKKILVDTKELGGRRIDITGGEPTLRRDYKEIISAGKTLDYKIELVTNASLLDAEKLRELRNLGLDGIAISVDGSNSEIYNRVRKRDEETFQRVLSNIREAVNLGFYTKVNSVVFDFNYGDMPKISDLCLDMGVKEHGIYYFTPVGRGVRSSESAIDPVKWLEFIRREILQYKDSGIEISLETPLIEKEYWNPGLGCVANTERSHLQILPDGNVYPCAILASYQKPIANLTEKSVRDIWENKGLWDGYWKDISCLFKGESCVDFRAFDLSQYDMDKYGFVCPIRKFKLTDLIK